LSEPKKKSRRSFLKYGAGVVAVGVVAAAGYGVYQMSQPGPAPPTPTVTATVTASPTLTPTTAPPPFTGTLQLFAWDYHPELIKKHLGDYQKLYGTNVNLNVLPYPGYLASVQAKIMGGEPIDDIYVQLKTQVKWFNAGWLRALDDLDGANDIKKGMFPAWLPRYSHPKTKQLITLPYWVGSYVNMINDRIRNENGFDWPKTLDDIYDQCKKLSAKGMKAPYTAYWSYQLEESVVTYMAGEGLDLFDSDGKSLFKDDPKTKYVLNWMRSMVKDKCTSPTILTDDVGPIVQLWMNGDSYINHWHTYFIETYNRSGQGKELGKCKIPPVPPGSAGKTIAIGDNYGMMAKAQDVNAAWTLLRFMGAKEPKTGKFEIATGWATETGLMSPYPDLWDDPTVKSSVSTWADFDLFKKYVGDYSQMVNFRQNFVWYDEWVTYMEDTIKKMLVGQGAVEDVPGKLAAKADQLRSGT
jgi:multiple sugar transport system substrate-binding protein